MATKKLSELVALTSMADGDLFLINDVSEGADVDKPKKITGSNLKAYTSADLTPAVALKADMADVYRQDGRLTLASGNPDVLTDQADKTTLYFEPYTGDTIALYTSSAWALHNFSASVPTLAVSGLSASTLYDIFAYNNSGTVTLEGLAWSNATTRATGLVRQNGVYVKSGDATRRYLGTVRVQSDTKFDDRVDFRGVYNHYNQILKALTDFTEAAKTMYFVVGNPNGVWLKYGTIGTIGGFCMQYLDSTGSQSATTFEAGQQRSTTDVVGSGISLTDIFPTGYNNVVRTSNDYTHLERCAFWIEYYG
jgi:hypothetical protein